MQVHHLHGYIQSIYLVEYPNKLLLLDGCSRSDVPLICDFITQELKRPLSDLALIVVTHVHPDHAGAVKPLQKITGAKVATGAIKHTQKSQWYGGFSGTIRHKVDMALALFVAKKMHKPVRNTYFPRKLQADYYLHEGDALPFFPEWQVLSTAGHTDRDISLIHLPSKRAYIADVIIKIKQGKFISPFPIFEPVVYKHSLQKLMDANLATLWLAHGGHTHISHADFQQLQSTISPDAKTYLPTLKTIVSNKIKR